MPKTPTSLPFPDRLLVLVSSQGVMNSPTPRCTSYDFNQPLKMAKDAFMAETVSPSFEQRNRTLCNVSSKYLKNAQTLQENVPRVHRIGLWARGFYVIFLKRIFVWS